MAPGAGKPRFELSAPFSPSGDQPQAIREIAGGLRRGVPHQTLLGVTGSGKTFTMANIIAELDRPALVISHNKTLAAQLYNEFKDFFPRNAVEYFVSYYDYYQPEAYLPQTDTYIEKDSSINDEIDRLRLKATASLLERRDVVVVASVSCIYGLGSPAEFGAQRVEVKKGGVLNREQFLRSLVNINYSRNDIAFERGSFRARGDVVEVRPAYDDQAVRVEFFGDTVERLARVDVLTGKVLGEQEAAAIFPATHFVTPPDRLQTVLSQIQAELEERLAVLNRERKLIEAQRLATRTRYDLEMIKEIGYCSGIENYSRVFDGRAPGTPPSTLLDYFPKDFIVFIDESHVSVPQIGGMYFADRSRKEVLVEHGFRLPCAMDNRPLTFEEFGARVNAVVYVSATPADYELEKSGGVVVEQLLRPTGILDPVVELHPARHQVDHLAGEIKKRLAVKERVLVTTLTKKMAEDLTEYLAKLGLPVRYLHSDIDTLERSEILRDLRKGVFEVLVGINLLREGLDLPEVGLVAVLDADKEGFLRSARSLIQTMGRAARNVNGTVILYADRETDSMRRAVSENNRRREHQAAYNKAHNIVPRTIVRKIEASLSVSKKEKRAAKASWTAETDEAYLTQMMNHFASELKFEEAAQVRDRIKSLQSKIS